MMTDSYLFERMYRRGHSRGRGLEKRLYFSVDAAKNYLDIHEFTLLRSFQPSHGVFCTVELFHTCVSGTVVAGDEGDIDSVRFQRQVKAAITARSINHL